MQQACAYPEDYGSMTLDKQLVMSEYAHNTVFGIYACTPFKWQYLVMLACVLIWLVIGRFVYQLYIRVRLGDFTFSLAAMLTKKDNKALAVDFAT